MTATLENRVAASEFEKSCSVLVSVGTELPDLERQCRHAYNQSRPDGYSTSSALDGGAPSSVVDENGDSMPPLSDPTGETVVALQAIEANPIGRALHNAKRLMQDAERAAEQARAYLLAAINPPAELEPEPDPNLWCSVCIKVQRTPGAKEVEGKKTQVLNPVHRVHSYSDSEPARARCFDCDGWARMAAQDPVYPKERPKAIILLAAEGRRITTKDVDATVKGAR